MESYALLLAATLNAGTVLALAALGLLINEKAGIVNLGAEGMMLCSAIAGFAAVVHTGSDIAGFAAGMGAGAFLAAWPMGKLVDRYGPKKMWAISAVGQAATFSVWPFITDFQGYVAMAVTMEVIGSLGGVG